MRKLLLICALSVAFAPGPAQPAPVVTDGSGKLRSVRTGPTVPLTGEAAAQAMAAAIDEFARAGRFGGILAEAAILTAPGTATPDLRHIVAAAQAAAGQAAAAEAQLAAAPPTDADAWGRIAEALLARRAGDLDQAGILIAAAIAAAPENAYAHNLAGTIALAGGDLEAAAAGFASAVALGPDGAPYLANLGATLVELGDAATARPALMRALELDPDDCTALIAAARTAPAEAPGLLSRCLAATPDHPSAGAELFAAYLAEGDPAAARIVLMQYPAGFPEPELSQARLALHEEAPAAARAALAAAPATGQAALLAALAFAMEGELAAAAHEADRAGEVEGAALARLAISAAAGSEPEAPAEGPAAQLFAVLAGAGQGSDAQTLAALQAAGEALPGLRFEGLASGDLAPLARAEVRAALALGLLYDILGLPRPARAAHAAAVAAAPGSALALLVQGRGLMAADRHAALAAFDAAIAQAPQLGAAHRYKADLLSRVGDAQGALDHLTAALAVREDAAGRLMQGVLAEHLGEDAAARAAYERVIVIEPGHVLALNQLAWFLATRETELDHALALAERADTLQPGNASVLDTKGWILFLAGDTTGAVEALRAAHAIDAGERPVITLHLAEAEAAAGDRQRAGVLLREITDRVPAQDPVAARAATLLAEIGG